MFELFIVYYVLGIINDKIIMVDFSVISKRNIFTT